MSSNHTQWRHLMDHWALPRRLGFGQSFAVMVIAVFGHSWLVASEAPRLKGDTIGELALGTFSERKRSGTTIDLSELSFGLEKMVTRNLGLFGSTKVSEFRGERDGRKVDTVAFGVAFTFRWHLVNRSNWGMFLEHGWGLSFADESFPPGGTELNGTRQFGLGVERRIGVNWLALLTWNSTHLSNGRGLVADNPSYDASGIRLGVRRVFNH